VPSNVTYPTDSGLLAKAITRIAATQRRVQAAGGATRTTVRDRSRAAGKRAHSIGAKLRTRSAAGKDEAQAAVRRVTSELADLAQAVAKDADRVLANAKQALRRARAKAKDRPANGERDAAAGRRRGRLARAVNDLTELVGATRKIAAQTRQRLAGTTPQGATRRVSLHDPTPARSPSTPFFSWPRCSVISSSSADYSTVAVIVFNNPTGPLMLSTRARTALTSSVIAARSASPGAFLAAFLAGLTPTSVSVRVDQSA
jgi:hypothetical protein